MEVDEVLPVEPCAFVDEAAVAWAAVLAELIGPTRTSALTTVMSGPPEFRGLR